MTLFNGNCNNCIYGDGKPLTCNACEGMLRGGFYLPCDLKEKNSYNCDPNAYSFNNSNHFPQPQYENYLCNLCGDNSHDGYDCQQQFPFVYEQEPSYNQNYNDNYYPHESPSFPCSDQIQTPQYPDVHPSSQETSEEVFQAKGDLMKSIQTFLEEFNCIPFEEKPLILLQAWFKFFAFRHAQLEDSNELFQKLLKDLKELAEYNNSPSRDRSTFFNDNKDHSIFLTDDENKESLENSSNEIDTSNSNQEKEEPPQDIDIRQLIREECCIEVSKEQKPNMENTILELVEICRQKELFCMHDNVEDLIESYLNSKLLSINLNSQRLNKKEQEVKNVVEQPAEHGTLTPILSTKEPEHSLSMGYEHISITPETKSDEVTESNAKNLLPIPSECEVTSEDENKRDMPAKDDCSPAFITFSNPLFKDNDDLDYSDNKSLPEEDVLADEFKVYSNPLFDEDEINSDKLDPHCFNVEYDFVETLLNRVIFIDSSSKFDFSGELADVNPEITESDFDFEEEIHLIENLLYDNSSSQPPKEHNAEEERIKKEHAEYISRMEMLFTINPRPRPTIDIVTKTDDVLPPSFENGDDSEGEIDVVEELPRDNSIPLTEDEASDSDHQEDPSFPRPPPEPPDAEFDFEPDVGKEIQL
nr:hypothetical protein [Tanacetum cinerariifolium]